MCLSTSGWVYEFYTWSRAYVDPWSGLVKTLANTFYVLTKSVSTWADSFIIQHHLLVYMRLLLWLPAHSLSPSLHIHCSLATIHYTVYHHLSASTTHQLTHITQCIIISPYPPLISYNTLHSVSSSLRIPHSSTIIIYLTYRKIQNKSRLWRSNFDFYKCYSPLPPLSPFKIIPVFGHDYLRRWRRGGVYAPSEWQSNNALTVLCVCCMTC